MKKYTKANAKISFIAYNRDTNRSKNKPVSESKNHSGLSIDPKAGISIKSADVFPESTIEIRISLRFEANQKRTFREQSESIFRRDSRCRAKPVCRRKGSRRRYRKLSLESLLDMAPATLSRVKCILPKRVHNHKNL